MMRLWFFMLCHHRPEQIEMCLEHAERFATLPHTWALLWQHYPMGGKEKNKRKLEAIVAAQQAAGCDVTLYDVGRGLGCRGGINYLLGQMDPTPGDYFAIYDPDERPVTRGWDEAAIRVMANKTRVAQLSLNSERIEEELTTRGAEERVVEGTGIAIPMVPCMAGLSMFDAHYFAASGGYVDAGGDYGGLELHFWARLMRANMLTGYLSDYWLGGWAPSKLHIDREYTDWKFAHAHQGYSGSFEDYLSEKGIAT